MDLTGRLVFEKRHRQEAEFLRKKLETCSISVNLASMMMYQAGNRLSAKPASVQTEQGYAMILRSLSVPQYSKHLTTKALQECTAQMKVLRKMLEAKPNSKPPRKVKHI